MSTLERILLSWCEYVPSLLAELDELVHLHPNYIEKKLIVSSWT